MGIQRAVITCLVGLIAGHNVVNDQSKSTGVTPRESAPELNGHASVEVSVQNPQVDVVASNKLVRQRNQLKKQSQNVQSLEVDAKGSLLRPDTNHVAPANLQKQNELAQQTSHMQVDADGTLLRPDNKQQEAPKAAAVLEARKQIAADKVADAAAKVKAADAFNILPSLQEEAVLTPGHARSQQGRWATWEPAEKTTMRQRFGLAGLLFGVMIGVLAVTAKSTKPGEHPASGRWQHMLMSVMGWFKAYCAMMFGTRDKGLATQEAATKGCTEAAEVSARDKHYQRRTEREQMSGELEDDQGPSAPETEACPAKVDYAAQD